MVGRSLGSCQPGLSDAGEAAVSARDRVLGIGRTRAEAIAYYSAVQDIKEARTAANRRHRFELFEQHQQDIASGDLTAPSEVDVSELHEMRQRAAKFREKQTTIELARKAAADDRAAERRTATRRFARLFRQSKAARDLAG